MSASTPNDPHEMIAVRSFSKSDLKRSRRMIGLKTYYGRCSDADLIAAIQEHGEHLQAIYAEQRRRLGADDETKNQENI